MLYKHFKYIYPPRPETKITQDKIERFDEDEYFAFVKYNGDCTIIFMNETETHVYNRHGEKKQSSKLDGIDFRGMYSGSGWMVVCGELMVKGKLGEDGKPLKGFIIWDILVYCGTYLVGTRLSHRMGMIEGLWEQKFFIVNECIDAGNKFLIHTHIKGVYRAPYYTSGFEELFSEASKVDAYEGILLKKKDAKLDFGYNPINNNQWAIKCRKPTANYKF